MAGTPTAFDPTKLIIGPVNLWVVPSPPAAGAYFSLATDGTPDNAVYTGATAAKHLGSTKDGIKFKDGATFTEFFADEFPDAILTKNTGGAVEISGTLQQGADTDLLVLLSPGRGTKFTATGKEGITGGTIALAFNSVVATFQTVADPTKYHVIQLYKAYNASGIEIPVTRKTPAELPFTFKGLAIASRVITDTSYAAWKMT